MSLYHQRSYLFWFISCPEVPLHFSRRTPKLGTSGMGEIGGDDLALTDLDGAPMPPGIAS